MHLRSCIIWGFFCINITYCGVSSTPHLQYDNENISGAATLHRNIRDTGTQTLSGSVDTKAVNGSMQPKTGDSGSSSLSTNSSKSIPTGDTYIKSKAPDLNYVSSAPRNYDDSDTQSENNPKHSTASYPGQPKFDEKAVQRALVVIAGLALILLVYLGAKFIFLRKRKVDKRYGRIESEIDLLDEIEDGDTEEEDDTLFDANSTRRSQF